MPRPYAWTITEDKICDGDDTGITGPSDAPRHLLARLRDNPDACHTFRMFDDDGELYYIGKAAWDEPAEGTEEACAGPLDDFGRPNAGCTLITWQDHPEWDIG